MLIYVNCTGSKHLSGVEQSGEEAPEPRRMPLKGQGC